MQSANPFYRSVLMGAAIVQTAVLIAAAYQAPARAEEAAQPELRDRCLREPGRPNLPPHCEPPARQAA